MSPRRDWLNPGPGSEASQRDDPADPVIVAEPDGGAEAKSTEKASADEGDSSASASAEVGAAGGAGAGEADGADGLDGAGALNGTIAVEQPGAVEESGAGAADAARQAGAAGQAGAGAAGAGAAGAEGQADQQDGADRRVWSGRAVGPLSGLLPGGAAELNAAEALSEPASDGVARDARPAPASTGDYEWAAVAGADDHELPAAPAVGDQRSVTPAGDGDHQSSYAFQGETSTATEDGATADATEEPEPGPEPGLTATDDRWHSVLVDFVDDPRGSVETARALIDQDIASHIALLARRREAMHAAWQAGNDADTEALRVALVKYRDLRKRLADVVSTLTA